MSQEALCLWSFADTRSENICAIILEPNFGFRKFELKALYFAFCALYKVFGPEGPDGEGLPAPPFFLPVT